ncbi:stage III sporulation protein AF [Alteribacillus sp. HJP-4]|uniref:stage III sporulation protein AF n=1 Tax=Alteribacillus sp. HJP-4 TaxID=2775394 RepID=UPI0035CCEB3F
MDWLQAWVINIIIFLLTAFLLELLLPSTSYQKYIRLLLSFILILLILDPLLSIVRGDANQAWRAIEESEEVTQTAIGTTKNLMEQKKIEIESGQDAYILEKVSDQLKDQVNKQVKEKWGWSISSIDANWRTDNKRQQDLEVTVALTPSSEEKEEDAPGPIDIDVNVGENADTENNDDTEASIRSFLSKQWGISEKQIHIIAEEGGARE